MTVSGALREGWRLAFSRSWPALLLFAAGAGELFAATAAPLALGEALAGGDARALWSAAAGLSAGFLACRAARAVILYATFGAAPARALGYFALSAALELLLRLWWWTGLLASVVAWVRQVGEGAAVAPSLAMAVTLAFGLLLTLFFAVWSDVALARSTSRDEPFSASLAEAAGDLARRPAAPLVVVALTGIARWMVDLGGTSLAALAGSAGSPRVSLWARVIAGLLAALAWAVLELSRIGALQALGREPKEAPPAPPPPEPEKPAPPAILDALPVDAPGSPG